MTETVLELTVDSAAAKQRLDTYITKNSELSRSRVQQLIEEGRVRIDRQLAGKAGAKVKASQKITVEIPELVELKLAAEDIELDIAYEDKDLVVVNKPANMVVHPAPGHFSGTLVNALLYHCQDLSGINGVLRPGIVHRLDKDTSGLIIVAKNDFAHASLSAQLKQRLVSRHYWAIVQGHLTPQKGIINTLIGRSRTNRLKMSVLQQRGKPAVTAYQTLAEFKAYSLVELKLGTGRTHQIRVHLKHIGHPVVGDPLYGSANKNLCDSGQWLHAAKLSFIHPRLQKEIKLTCLPPAARMALLVDLSAAAGIDIDIGSLIEF